MEVSMATETVDVSKMVAPWVKWDRDSLTSTFWHSLSNEDGTICGMTVPHESQNVSVTDGEPKLDACGRCKSILRGDDPVFKSSVKVSRESQLGIAYPDQFNPDGTGHSIMPPDYADGLDD